MAFLSEGMGPCLKQSLVPLFFKPVGHITDGGQDYMGGIPKDREDLSEDLQGLSCLLILKTEIGAIIFIIFIFEVDAVIWSNLRLPIICKKTLLRIFSNKSIESNIVPQVFDSLAFR